MENKKNLLVVFLLRGFLFYCLAVEIFTSTPSVPSVAGRIIMVYLGFVLLRFLGGEVIEGFKQRIS